MTINPVSGMDCATRPHRKAYNPTKAIALATAIVCTGVCADKLTRPDEIKLMIKEYGGKKQYFAALGAITLGLSSIFSFAGFLSNMHNKKTPCKN